MNRYTGHALLLVLGALFIFHSPFTRWWAELNLPWYSVFVFWLIMIVLVAVDNFKVNPDSKATSDTKASSDSRFTSLPDTDASDNHSTLSDTSSADDQRGDSQ